MEYLLNLGKPLKFTKALVFLLIMALAPITFAKTSSADIQQITLNNIVVLSINDSSHTFDATIFTDIDNYPTRKAMMPNGKYKTLTKTYLIKTDDRTVLVDSGLGTESGVVGRTQQILLEQGIQPTDITDILLTHMDIDHIAGLIQQGQAVYPQATLHIARVEYQAWVIDGADREAEYIALARQVAELYQGRIKLFEYGDTLLPNITAQDARGHTAGHTSYDIVSGDRGLTIVGDMLHVAPIQLRFTDYCTIYDADPKLAAATRERILNKLSQQNRLIAGMHFPQIGKVLSSPDGGYIIVPVE